MWQLGVLVTSRTQLVWVIEQKIIENVLVPHDLPLYSACLGTLVQYVFKAKFSRSKIYLSFEIARSPKVPKVFTNILFPNFFP